METIDIIFWWGVVGVISNVGILVTFWIMATKMVSFKFPLKKVAKYIVVTSIVSLIVYLLLTENLEYQKEILLFVPNLIPYVIMFVAIYLGLILLWDKDTRILVKQIVEELKK